MEKAVEFKVGDRVEYIERGTSLKYGETYTVSGNHNSEDGITLEGHGKDWWFSSRFKKANDTKTLKEENVMNAAISKIFKKDPLELAELVEKHFGGEVTQDFTGELVLEANKPKYIAEAEKREKEEKEAAKC